MQVSRASFCCEFLVQVSRTSVFGITTYLSIYSLVVPPIAEDAPVLLRKAAPSNCHFTVSYEFAIYITSYMVSDFSVLLMCYIVQRR